MPNLVFPIMLRIEDAVLSNEIVNIENDQEFYFLVGQCIYYIAILRGEKLLINDVYLAIARDNQDCKNYLRRAFQNTVAQKTPIEGNLYSKIYLSIIDYNPLTSIKIDENSFAFMAGYMTNNIFLSKIKEVITIREASELWKKDDSTLRKAFIAGERFKRGYDCRQSGSTWLVTKYAMEKVYGKINK